MTRPADDGQSGSPALELPVGAGGVALCRGCEPDGRCSLGIARERLDDDGRLRADLRCPTERQGVYGIAHGGWVADVLDELLGKRVYLEGPYAVTRRLEIRFHRPTPVDADLRFAGWLNGGDAAGWTVAGELRDAATGDLLATGEADFVGRDTAAHASRFTAWRARGRSTGFDGKVDR